VTAEIVLLVIIALAVTTMAVAQLLSLRHIMQMAARASSAIEDLQRTMAPILKNAHDASETAARVAALAEDQLTRIDAVVRKTTERVDEMVETAHDIVTGPARQASALVAGLRAAWDLFSARRAARAPETEQDDDESGMFVG
jgi:methyl-accepting chemotaxis protein